MSENGVTYSFLSRSNLFGENWIQLILSIALITVQPWLHFTLPLKTFRELTNFTNLAEH